MFSSSTIAIFRAVVKYKGKGKVVPVFIKHNDMKTGSGS
jgi:hypothetical protein